MNEKRIKRLILVIFLISIVIACFASVCVGRYFAADNTPLPKAAVRELSHGWDYEADTDTGRKEIDHLPAIVRLNNSSGGITLYYQLPENLPINACLEFVSQHTSVEVFLDGQSIYTYGINEDASKGRLLGNSRNVIVLPNDAGGKEIAIRLVSSYSSDIYRISTINLGSKAELLHRFIYHNIGLIVFCLFSAFFYLLILFVVIFFKFKKVHLNDLAFISFAMFIFLSAVWIATDSNILQLLTSNFAQIYFISHMVFMLLPVPLMIFMTQTTSYGRRWYNIFSIMYLLGFFLRVGLFFGKIADLETTLVITHGMMVISAVGGCILLIKEWRLNHDKTVMMFLVGFIALGICLLASMVIFFVSPEPKYSGCFTIMLTLMIIAMLYKLVSQLQYMVKEGLESKIYHEMAYIDVLTKLSNRMSFDEHMHTIQEKPDCYTLTILMLDINGLKYINDTYGHSTGDTLIKCAADCIRDQFSQVGKCYRIGGDEFVVILKDFSEQSLEKILEEFQVSVCEADCGSPEGLSISVGYATGPAEGENFAYHLFDKADQCMYIKKREFHQQGKKLSEIC